MEETLEKIVAPRAEIEVLLVEDDWGDAELVRHALLECRDACYRVVHVDRLAEAIRKIRENPPDVILLDLSLPDGVGLDTFLKISEHVLDIPVVVLTGLDDSELAMQAVERGAQDYLCKKDTDDTLLPRIIRHAMQRQTLVNELRVLSLTDDLTGLYNRRGFTFLAQQQLQSHKRHPSESLRFLFIDMDNMKVINDRFGHPEGDRALVEFSGILKGTFRSSDIVGRVGGDEFAILVTERSKERLSANLRRLNEMIVERNTAGLRPYQLGFSVGVTPFDPRHPLSVEEFLKRADDRMYEEKRAKKLGRRASPNGPA